MNKELRLTKGQRAGTDGRFLRTIPFNSLTLFSFLCLLGSILMLSGLLFLWTADHVQAAPPAQEPDSPPSVSSGSALWSENCQPCHGPTGQGDGPSAEGLPNPPADLSNPATARQLAPVENFDVIKNGRMENFMPPWSNRLSDAEIWDTVAQVWRLSTTAQDIGAGETIYLEECAACHGPNGAGNGPEAPAGINDLTDLQVMVQQSQADLLANYLASDQHTEVSDLSEAEVWQTLDYIRTFTFIVPQRNGVLSGQVINATTNEPVGNVEVTLHIFQGNSEIETLTTQADNEGNYTFENLPTEHSNLYVPEASYQNINYLSDEPAVFVPDSTEASLDLNVYDTTTAAEAIDITQMHYLVSFSPGTIDAVQVFVVGNNDDRTYVGQDGQTFSFSLPEEASNVTFQDDLGGSRFVQTGTGYADTEPITPGEEGLSIVASYSIPYNDDSLTIEIPLPADVISLNVLQQELGANVESDQLDFVETRQVQGDSFSILNASNLSAGESLVLEFTNLDDLDFAAAAPNNNAPAATVPTASLDQNLLRWAVLGLLGLVVVVAAVVYPQMRPKLTHQTGIQHDDPAIRRQKLLLTLARLDEVFEAGELDAEVYHRARTKYKTELAELMRASGQSP